MHRDIPSTINEVTNKLQKKIELIHDVDYNPGPIPLTRLKNWVRESYQDLFKDEIKTIILKIKQRQQLTDKEMKIMEFWMIGDLEMYTKLEQHVEDWVESLQNNIDQLNSFNTKGIEKHPENLLKIQGIIIELDHTLNQLEQYQYAIERVQRYKSYVGVNILQLDDTKRYELAKVLQEMINSPLH